MADDINNSLVDIGKLAEPANTLVKKISKAVGGIFEPFQIKRVAKADAEAAIISANADIEIEGLRRRALHRFIEEEARNQKNIEEITAQSIPLLNEASNADEVEDDWITNFFDKSRIVSDAEMQELWSRVLAGEVNSPGSFSKRSVNFLADIDKYDAELFVKLCGFSWQIGDLVPLIFDSTAEIYTKSQINFGAISHLESIGLIQFNSLSGFRRQGLPDNYVVTYYNMPLLLGPDKNGKHELKLGKVLFTKVGQEMASVCGGDAVEGFFEYVEEQWKEFIPTPDVS